VGQFGIGQAVRRKEDVRFITGTGRFTDDIRLDGEAHAYFLRSPHAHARIAAIDTAAAKSAPGVLAVLTHADVEAAGLGPIKAGAPFIKNRDGSPHFNPGRPQLAADRVRHVGDPLAMVVAGTLAQAKDAAELIDVSYEPLPVVTDPVAAAKSGAPQLYDDLPGNVALDWQLGDEAATAAAFARADKVVKLDLAINRIVVAPMEPRGTVASYDRASDRYTVHMGTQGAFAARGHLARALNVDPAKVRVITPDVGGGFGMKGFDFPEHTLTAFAAKQIGRPVRWASDRQEAFLSDTQGREQHVTAELALDKDGKFLAIRADTHANVGAYLSFFSLVIPTMAGFRLLTGAYRIPSAFVRVRAVVTNTVWVDAYRGAGRPEVSYIVERLVNAAAREMGMSAAAIRRKNFVPKSAMPYQTPMIVAYDSGDFRATMDKALEAADWKGASARRREAKRRGKLHGVGVSYYMEVTANAPQELADIKFRPDGRVTMGVGTGPTGQGHETAFAQILEDRLGIPFDKIDFVFGDTDQLKSGGGTGGAKSLMLAGTALVDVSERIVAKGKRLAGHFLEAAAGDIEFNDGTFAIAGTDRSIFIMDLAKRAMEAKNLPEDLAGGLDEIGKSTTDKNTFPNGCHICEVEVDADTGHTQVVRYTVVDDFGAVVNPLILKGQAHGGIAQGIGQALLENAVYDDGGQLVTASFQDYAMPRALDLPDLDLDFNNVPCRTNVLGIKGAGEAGTVGALGAVMNAVVDALSPLGIAHIDMPASPSRVWQAIRQANGKGASASA
jgi:aerobic carbon-monoxide dehydrogenase large subunit